MYRESHERKCPTYGEWISATAPKCFNCGEYVADDDDDDDDQEPAATTARAWRLVGAVAVLAAAGITAYSLVK